MTTDILYQDLYLKLVRDAVNGIHIESYPGALCVPITDTGMVIFIAEPAPAYGEHVLTLPGGGIEPEEVPVEAANRELQEEIGYKALKIDVLGTLRPWEKYLKAEVHVFLVRHLVASKLHGDEIYEITTQLVPINDFERLIRDGQLHDSSVIAALYMARDFLMREMLDAND